MPSSWLRPGGLSFVALSALLISDPGRTTAQIVLDGKFGSSGALSGPNYTITPGMGATRGNNLFHSFSQFNLQSGQSANFTGPANIQNILSRVTGASPSSINGTISSDIPGANFFFINPNGVIFGPKAAVNVSGSFAVSTANYLKLADGARFVASLDADDSGLSTAPVSAFGFLGTHPGSISVESALSVATGQTISIVGGDIVADAGSVKAPQGQINVVSVKSAGEVPIDPTSLSAEAFKAAFPQEGQINLKNLASIDASGDGGGRIVIRGGQLIVDNSSIQANTTGSTDGKGIDVAVSGKLALINGGQIESLSDAGLGASGDINIRAQSILLNGEGAVDPNTFLPSTQISTVTGDIYNGGGPGRGGNITIKTGNLSLFNNAQVSATSFGAGNAGNIDITANSVSVDALITTFTWIIAQSQTGGGNAGAISIHTGTLDLRNGAIINVSSFSGDSGSIDITAKSINLLSAGGILAATYGSGKGGNIEVSADLLNIDGRDLLTGAPDWLTGIQAITTLGNGSGPNGPGGKIQLNVGSLQMEHMATIFTSSYDNGPGGDIQIHAGRATLDNNSTINAEGSSPENGGFGTGSAGRIFLNVDGNLQLTQKSVISTAAPVSSGGDIQVTAGNQIQLFDSEITAQAGPGGGGNITLKAPSMIYLLNSSLNAQAVGDGGNLSVIDPVFFIGNTGSLISKSTSKNGGNITILSDYFFTSVITIDASAPFGLPGTVSVSAPQVDLSGVLVGLPSNLLDAGSQLRPDCAVRLSGGVSSFTVLGRGGLPIAPGGFVPSSTMAPFNDAR